MAMDKTFAKLVAVVVVGSVAKELLRDRPTPAPAPQPAKDLDIKIGDDN